MHFFNQIENWPVVAICVGMLAAAIIDWAIFKVPNKLDLPADLRRLALGSPSARLDPGYNGAAASLPSFVGTFVAWP